MFISKWRPPLAAILKTYNRNIFKSKNPISMQFASKRAVFQTLLDKSHLYFSDPFPLIEKPPSSWERSLKGFIIWMSTLIDNTYFLGNKT